eukprot:gene4805-biopygen17536
MPRKMTPSGEGKGIASHHSALPPLHKRGHYKATHRGCRPPLRSWPRTTKQAIPGPWMSGPPLCSWSRITKAVTSAPRAPLTSAPRAPVTSAPPPLIPTTTPKSIAEHTSPLRGKVGRAKRGREETNADRNLGAWPRAPEDPVPPLVAVCARPSNSFERTDSALSNEVLTQVQPVTDGDCPEAPPGLHGSRGTRCRGHRGTRGRGHRGTRRRGHRGHAAQRSQGHAAQRSQGARGAEVTGARGAEVTGARGAEVTGARGAEVTGARGAE